MATFSDMLVTLLKVLVLQVVVVVALTQAQDMESLKKEYEDQMYLNKGAIDLFAPQDLDAEALSSTKLNVSWTAPNENVQTYIVDLSYPLLHAVITDTFYIISGLQPCHDYEVIVYACYKGDTDCYPDSISGKAGFEIPSAPSNCQIVNVTSASLKVVWEAPVTDCPMNPYHISWDYKVLWLVGEEGTIETDNEGNSYPARDLTPYTQYTFTITAATDAGMGVESLVCPEATTEDGKPGLAQISDIIPDTKSTTITWLPPKPANGIIMEYNLTLTSAGISDARQNVAGDQTQAQFSDLEVCTDYTVEIEAKTRTEWGDKTSENFVLPDESPPAYLNCSEVDSTNLTACWDPTNGDCPDVNYLITWTGQILWSQETDTGNLTVEGKMEECECELVEDLVPYTSYTVCVSVNTNPDASTCSSVQTLEDVPGPVQFNEVISGNRSATITWFPANPANGIILHYNITLSHDTGPLSQTVDGTVLEATFTDLVPCRRYTVFTEAKTSSGWGQGNSKTIFVQEDMSPETLDCSAVEATGLSVCWEPAEYVCPDPEYVISWQGDVLWSGDKDSGSTTINDSSQTCEEVVELVPYTAYTVCVNVGRNTTGPCCIFTTMEGAPSAPYLQTHATANNLTATWTEPQQKNGNLTGYMFTWVDPSGVEHPEAVKSTVLSYYLPDMLWCETYSLSVQAANKGGGWGIQSNTEDVFVANSITEGGLECSGNETRAALVTWGMLSPTCPVSHFLVDLNVSVLWSNEIDSGSMILDGTETKYTIKDLQPYSQYTICVIVEGSLESPRCCINTTQEDVSTRPNSLKMTTRTTSSLSFNWTLPKSLNGELKSWLVTYSAGDQADEANLESNLRNHTFSDLSADTSYKIFVMAVNGAGQGEPIQNTMSTQPTQKDNSTLIIVFSVLGGLLLLVLLVMAGFYYRRNVYDKTRRESVTSLVDNYIKADLGGGGVDDVIKMNDFDTYSNDMYNKQLKSYKEDNLNSEDNPGTDEVDGNSKQNESRRNSTQQMEKEFGKFGVMPRVSLQHKDTLVAELAKKRYSFQQRFEAHKSKDLSRRYSMQPNMEVPKSEYFPRRQSMKPELERRMMPRRKLAHPDIEMINLEYTRRRQSLENDPKISKIDNSKRRYSLQPKVERNKGDDFSHYKREARRHSVYPDIIMKSPAEFPDIYAQQPQGNGRRSSYDFGLKTSSYDSNISGRRQSIPNLHQRQSEPSLDMPYDRQDRSRRYSLQPGASNNMRTYQDPLSSNARLYSRRTSASPGMDINYNERSATPRRYSQQERTEVYRGEYRRPSQMFNQTLPSITDEFE